MRKFTIYNVQFKIKFLLLLLLLYILHFTLYIPVSAHLIGQPPFLKINNQYANLYPVPLTSLSNFDLPQDLAPENYLVNQPISFELDKSRLPAPPEVVNKTRFDWDFADGTHGQGLTNQHTYSKIGSYILKIYADDGTTPKPQIIESVLINAMPNKNYQLPQAKITINGKMSSDPLTDILSSNFKDSLQIDGSKSSSQNTITEYFWDFGDQKSSFEPIQTHQYAKDLSQTFIVLRVKDSNGFLSDNFVEVQNSLNEQNQTISSPTPSTPQPKKTNQLPLVLGGLTILICLIILARKFLLSKK